MDQDRYMDALVRQHVEPHMKGLLQKIGQTTYVHRDGMSNLHTLQLLCKRAAETVGVVDRALHHTDLSEELIAGLEDVMLKNAKNYLLENAETVSNDDYKRLSIAVDIGFAKIHARHVAMKLAIPIGLSEDQRQEYKKHTAKLTESAIGIMGGLLRQDSSVIDRHFATMRTAREGIGHILEATGQGDGGSILSHLFEEIKAAAESRIQMDEAQQTFFESALDDAIQGMSRRALPDLENWSARMGRG